MFTTPISFRMIVSDLGGALERIAQKPEVEREGAHYLARIGEIDTVEQFLADDRVYRYAMRAHGLEDMIYAKAFMRKVLTEGIDDRESFANSLADQRFRDFVGTFNFARYGAAATTFSRAQQGTVDNYVRQTLEVTAGQENDGVRLALYFQRRASSVTSTYSLLADKALLKVTQVALGLSESTAALDIDRQAELISRDLDVADLKDGAKLDRFLTRFTALWDIANPRSAGTSAPALLIAGEQAGIGLDLLRQIQDAGAGR